MGFPFPIFIKASRSRISVSKEIREVNRLRLQFERSMTARLMAVFKRVGKRAADEYTQSESVSDALRPLEGELEQVFRAHYRAVIEKFGDRVYENRKQERFAQLIFSYYSMEGAQKVRGVTVQTAKLIRRAIRAGEVEGEGVAKIAKRIREKTDGAIGRARSSTIARTETHAAASYATHEATKELGLPAQRKRWVSVSDGRTRSHHAAANGQEVGMDEPFIIRFNGQEIKMMYPHDGSGGPANNINCRCLALYFSDEDALFDSFVDDPVVPVVPVVPVEPVAPVVPIPAIISTQFKLPRDRSVTSENIVKISKKEAERQISEIITDGSDFSEYQFAGRWYGEKPEKYGSLSLGKSDAATATYIAQALKEIQEVGDNIGLPRLRGVQPVRNSKKAPLANMGGGVLGIVPDKMKVSLNIETDRGMRPRELEEVIAKIKVDEARQREVVRELGLGDDSDAYFAARKIQKELQQQVRDLEIELHYSKLRWAEPSRRTPDNDEDLPWYLADYFDDPLDKVRSLIYHEYGHHIHQTLKLDRQYKRSETFVEEKITRFFRSTHKTELERYAVGKYAMTNQYEYFVESFASYMMGRKELIHPRMKEIIEADILEIDAT